MAPSKRKQAGSSGAVNTKRVKISEDVVSVSDTALPRAFVHAKLASIRQVLAGGQSDRVGDPPVGLEEQYDALRVILEGTLGKGQGNSALIMGGRGTGKSLLLSSCLHSIRSDLSSRIEARRTGYYHVRLSAFQQTTDRLALREMARQLVEQGAFRDGDLKLDLESQDAVEVNEPPEIAPEETSVAESDSEEEGDDEEDEDEDDEQMLQAQLRRHKKEEMRKAARIKEEDAAMEKAMLQSLATTTSSIFTLLSSSTDIESATAASASRRQPLPLLITLEGFDIFTARPRQALLYCLLDAVQAGSYTPGLAVIGMSTRLDTIDLLEKRVKSRFSGRIVNTYSPRQDEQWTSIVRNALLGNTVPQQALSSQDDPPALEKSWELRIEAFIKDERFSNTLAALTEMSADVSSIYRGLFNVVSRVSIEKPHLDAAYFEETVVSERTDTMKAILRDLTKPEYALLVAATHLRLRDRPIFNFEMTLDEVRRFESASARDGEAARSSARAGHAEGGDATVEGGRQGEYVPIGGSKRLDKEGPLGNRKTALLAFQTLITHELFVPHISLSTLSSLAPDLHVSTSRGVQPQFVRVTCAVLPGLVRDGVKDPARKETLGTEMEKWALRDVVPTD